MKKNSRDNKLGFLDDDGANVYSPEQKLMLLKELLTILAKMRSDRLETWSKKLEGTTKMELHILLIIQQKPDIILSEIRERLDVPNSTLTGVIDRMEKRNVIERQISPRDRRSYGLNITENGMMIRREHDRILIMIASMILSTLDEKEGKTFIKLLLKVAENLPRI